MSLLNPWVLLSILLAISSAFGGGYWKGYKGAEADQAVEIARLNEQARKTELEAFGKVNSLSAQLAKATNNAKQEIQKRDADIANGTLRLSIATKSPVCPANDAAPTDGNNAARTELDPTVAQRIVAITDDGDTAIRKLNACIAVYNQVRDLINPRKP